MQPFTPADGVMPRWQKLYDLVRGRNVGDEVTYGEAQDLLKCDRKTAQQAMREAMARLERNGERTVGTVTHFGWIVLSADREVNQVDRRAVKTRRAAGRVLRGASALNTRRDELSQFDRQRLDWISGAAQVILAASSRQSRKTPEQLMAMLENGKSKEIGR